MIRRFGSSQNKRKWDEITNQVDITEFDDLLKAPPVEEAQKISLPEEFICLGNKNLPISAKAPLRYLKKRGITKKDIVKWKIGYCPVGQYKNRIIVPSFDDNGYCNYFIARAYTDDWLKYKNPPATKDIIFNDLYVDWSKELTLVEGVFDAIKAENAIPLLGSTLSENSHLFKKLAQINKPVFLALDADADFKTAKLVELLLQYNIETYKIDTSEFEDVGEMTKDQFKKKKDSAAFMDSNNYLLYKLNKIN